MVATMTLYHNPIDSIMSKLRALRIRFSLASCIALTMTFTMAFTTAGCGAESAKQVCLDIAQAIPTAKADINVASLIVSSLTTPEVALTVTGVTAIVDSGLDQIQTFATTYASTSNPTVLGSLADTLTKIMNTNAAALLDAAKIVDPVSRATALRILGAVQTALQLIYAIYMKLKNKAQVAATTAMLNYKLEDVAPYLDRNKVETATGVSFQTAIDYGVSQGL